MGRCGTGRSIQPFEHSKLKARLHEFIKSPLKIKAKKWGNLPGILDSIPGTGRAWLWMSLISAEAEVGGSLNSRPPSIYIVRLHLQSWPGTSVSSEIKILLTTVSHNVLHYAFSRRFLIDSARHQTYTVLNHLSHGVFWENQVSVYSQRSPSVLFLWVLKHMGHPLPSRGRIHFTSSEQTEDASPHFVLANTRSQEWSLDRVWDGGLTSFRPWGGELFLFHPGSYPYTLNSSKPFGTNSSPSSWEEVFWEPGRRWRQSSPTPWDHKATEFPSKACRSLLWESKESFGQWKQDKNAGPLCMLGDLSGSLSMPEDHFRQTLCSGD
jgi:hypothetical protein